MRSPPPLRLIAGVAALALFNLWITWRAKAIEMGARLQTAPSPLIGKPAPEFAAESLDGKRISLSDYGGKTLVATFWASWCGPCRLELPALAKLYQQQHKADSLFEILAISIDSARQNAAGAAKTLRLPFPVLLDLDNRISDAYHVEAIPVMFVIDRNGKVVSSHTGFSMTLDFMLAQELGIKNYNPVGDGK